MILFTRRVRESRPVHFYELLMKFVDRLIIDFGFELAPRARQVASNLSVLNLPSRKKTDFCSVHIEDSHLARSISITLDGIR